MNSGNVVPEVSAKISCEKTKVCITVDGDICTQTVRDEIEKKKLTVNKENLIIPDVISTSSGYKIELCDRKNFRSYLDETGLISCLNIFTVCECVKNLFCSCGKEVFEDILFDYNTVFIETNINATQFLYVPFLRYDRKRIRFREFLRILFVHMEESDAYSEQFVMRLLECVSKWENSNYDKNLLGSVTLCIQSFVDSHRKDVKKDFFSKGMETIRQFISIRNTDDRVITADRLIISIICIETKDNYSFGFDRKQNMFNTDSRQGNTDVKYTTELKVGRDKMWADIHVADMFTNARFGVITFNENCFCITTVLSSSGDITKECYRKQIQKLQNGSTFHIGKKRYNVMIKRK